ncbi:TetR family transcriptional regulator [Paenibacillus antibioticophila]|uniref:TetR family transcriptional regulator n=1 Tax=Paenibacillus antibioticophila TaxID=1274374 RepID=A0A920CG34_9BACL|nr:TetR/AcrR family transcriptional regulator [Paenibacillus antibioticophila]GIO35292.1 TetR family transcriptional regulator [Paenibacillus antibioticophila]
MSLKSADKKTLILRSAMQLFSAKGPSATSMQEIAEMCGMSKGSLYLHFKSKDELEQSLFNYCFQMLQEHLVQVELEQHLGPKERLVRQIEVLLNLVQELREFLVMQFQDWIKYGKLYREPDSFRENNITLLHFTQKALVSAFGERIIPYSADLVMVAQGILGAFIRLLFEPRMADSNRRMAVYLVDLLDAMVERLLEQGPEPLISEAELQRWSAEGNCLKPAERDPLLVIREMKEALGGKGVKLTSTQREDMLDTLQVLESEVLEPMPRRVVIRGMLLNVLEFPALEKQAKELERLLKPYLK